MKACNEFVSKVLLVRDKAHLAHWAAKGKGSYARHVALGEFYDKVLELLDGFVEQYQGAYEKLLDPKLMGDDSTDIETELKYQVTWIELNRYDICDKEDTALHNTIDELIRTYQTVLYKLNFLE